jgi:hypothetical protein
MRSDLWHDEMSGDLWNRASQSGVLTELLGMFGVSMFIMVSLTIGYLWHG